MMPGCTYVSPLHMHEMSRVPHCQLRRTSGLYNESASLLCKISQRRHVVPCLKLIPYKFGCKPPHNVLWACTKNNTNATRGPSSIHTRRLYSYQEYKRIIKNNHLLHVTVIDTASGKINQGNIIPRAATHSGWGVHETQTQLHAHKETVPVSRIQTHDQ